MGARGATASSEAADIVLTTDRVDRLADAMDIARWSRRIAVQSAVVGMSLSLAGDGDRRAGLVAAGGGCAAARGHRRRGDPQCAARPARVTRPPRWQLPADTEQMLRRFAAEHDELRDTLGLLRDSADRLAAAPTLRRWQSLITAHALRSPSGSCPTSTPRKPSSIRRWRAPWAAARPPPP